jgi:starch phosphorylase
MERVLPRHLQIIYDLNHALLQDVRKKYPDDLERVRTMSLIEEGRERQVRMANLAILGCRRVNGVSALHSKLLRTKVFPEFDEYFPGKFTNQTNGVTPRRWLLNANPRLAELITSRIGDGWITHLEQLKDLEEHADDPEFREQWRMVKRENKVRLARCLGSQSNLELDPNHLFDSQVKRIHEYKRQSLNIIHVVSSYLRLRSDPGQPATPRTFIIGGKAAPGYRAAKLLVQLIAGVSKVVNADRNTRDKLRVVFVPNYGVTLAEHIIPASDVSEQISVAGMEASGTGNMKFALNGALTVGTLDGATIEMKEAIGAEHMFLFGLTADEVEANRADGYDPSELYYGDDDLRATLDAIADGMFSPDKPDRFRGFVDQLIWTRDPYMVLADFKSYARCHQTMEQAYGDPAAWTRASILNVARMGHFSSDRAIRGYAREIWGVPVE